MVNKCFWSRPCGFCLLGTVKDGLGWAVYSLKEVSPPYAIQDPCSSIEEI